MKKLYSLLFFCFSILTVSSQGLNTEIGFNDDYSQTSRGLLTIDDYSYLVKFQNISGAVYSDNHLLKIDTSGNIIWNVNISSQLTNFGWVEEIISTPSKDILIIGQSLPCDVAMNCVWFIQKFDDTTGNVIWTKIWNDPTCFNLTLNGLSVDDSDYVYINHIDSLGSKILSLDAGGNLLDTLPIPHSNVSNILPNPNFEKIASLQNTVYTYDTNSNVVNDISFNSEIQDIKNYNDTLFILTEDSIFTYTHSLQRLNGNEINGFSSYSKLKLHENTIRFISDDLNNQHVLTLNHELQFINVISIPVSLGTNTQKDFSDSHFSTGIDFNLTHFLSIRYLDFSLKSTQNAFINTTDISVIDIMPMQVSAVFFTNPNVYNFKIYADVMIKNNGNVILNDCRLNNKIEQAICNYYVYTEHFSNLNLAPGDSMWISCGLVHSQINFINGDTLRYNLCIYSSHPNYQTDLNVVNDQFCKSVIVGYVGIDEMEKEALHIFPNPSSDFISIKTENNQVSNYTIFSILGEKIIDGNLILDKIDIHTLVSGMYLLQLYSKDEIPLGQSYFIKN